MNKELRFCGFVWFVIPKVILNLKVTWRDGLGDGGIGYGEGVGDGDGEEEEVD